MYSSIVGTDGGRLLSPAGAFAKWLMCCTKNGDLLGSRVGICGCIHLRQGNYASDHKGYFEAPGIHENLPEEQALSYEMTQGCKYDHRGQSKNASHHACACYGMASVWQMLVCTDQPDLASNAGKSQDGN